jgi:uncharacterized protein (UPF0261 family)
MRLTRSEITKLGQIMADKANKATAPTAVVIPLRGWSAYDQTNGPFCCDSTGKMTKFRWHDPGASEAFLASFEKQIDMSKSNLEVLKIDANINDQKFAGVVAQTILEMLKGTWKTGSVG